MDQFRLNFGVLYITGCFHKLWEASRSIETGFFLKFPDGVTRWMVPVWALGVTDWPEGQKFALVGAHASKSVCNCRVCRQRVAIFNETWKGTLGAMRKDGETRRLVEEFNRPGVTKKSKNAEEKATSQILMRNGLFDSVGYTGDEWYLVPPSPL